MDTTPSPGAVSSDRGRGPNVGVAVESLREQLLDISKRNRLLNAPVEKRSAKQLAIVDELSDETFRLLYLENKRFTFEPSPDAVEADESGEAAKVPLPDSYQSGGSRPAAHQVDLKLRTRHAAPGLQSKLLKIYRDATTVEEEQGVSVLFLALGFLRWYESDSSEKEWFAPLILLPVDLTRGSARGRFRLSYRDQDIEPNQSLGAMLASDFGLALPEFPAGDEWLPSAYFERVSEAVSSQSRWEVRPDTIVLSFYSFAKFMMWRDLSGDAEWSDGEGLNANPLLERLLVGGSASSVISLGSDENLDQRFADPKDLGHILDADTSQTQVIAAAREGRSLVVQGPPGTGKSQTIANIIAATAREGKRVLFVAEKRAALDVVHDRLERCGLGPLCLELHSHKANRKHVYQDLKDTLALGRPRAGESGLYEQVREVRDRLNHMSDLLHAVDAATGDTPFNIIGKLSSLTGDGHPQPEFQIGGADKWSTEGIAERQAATASLANLRDQFGSELRHPWRGVGIRLNPMERNRLRVRLQRAIECLDAVREAAQSGSAVAALEPAATPGAISDVLCQLDALDAMPRLVPDLVANEALVSRPGPVLELCELVASLQELESSLRGQVIDSALNLGWEEARVAIAQRGTSLFRWFSRPYREAVGRLKGVVRGTLTGTYSGRIALLDALLQHRRWSESVAKRAHVAQSALGHLWEGDSTKVAKLLPALRWIKSQEGLLGSGSAVKAQVEGIAKDADPGALSSGLRAARDNWTTAWSEIADTLGLDIGTAFGVDDLDAVPFDRLRSRILTWGGQISGIEGWHRLSTAARLASELGLDEIRARLADGRLAPAQAERSLEFVRAEAVWARMGRENQELLGMDGEERTELVEEFKSLDQRLQSLTAQEVAEMHHRNLPTGSSGQVGIVRGEANKKIRHMRLRRLLDKAGEAVAMIKPVFLMSPLSVAQYLRPGGLTFDILLIDEASQVRPADAMGAIMRARQIVVVGDQKQLPPTSFFDRQIVGDDDGGDTDDESEILGRQLGDMESVLSLCEARALSCGMLRWHYRSRHPSLIQVSNHEFYNDGLICSPSPDRAGKESGLTFEYVKGEYQRGKKRDNPKEADAIARRVLVHARERPGETLGVVAFSVAQRDTILNVLEWMRAENPELEGFCKGGRDEAFFVKNLENVQGDERDVIYISIGYGKDAGGYMSQSFGPVSAEGGERRLNVLFTRARRRCTVFSSIRYQDIRMDVSKHRGPRVLRRFLRFAETGEMDIPVLTGGEPDSPFEVAVAEAVQSHGYRVEGQVGSAGFLIDLAVYDPDDDGRFLLAIECDGARYHSSSWARERDRLRQAVLEQKGWKFHRIWSTDWFYNRDVEVRKLLEAIERARGPGGTERTPEPAPPAPKRTVVRREESAGPDDSKPPAQTPYVEASFSVAERGIFDLREAPAPTVAGYVVAVVDAEGPIHRDEIARRVSRLWGHKMLGALIRKAVEEGIAHALRNDRIRPASADSEDFFDRAGAPDYPATVRDRRHASASVRKPQALPPTEIRAGILQAVKASVAVSPKECAVDVARMFGYARTTAGIQRLFQAQASVLVSEGELLEVDGQLRLP